MPKSFFLSALLMLLVACSDATPGPPPTDIAVIQVDASPGPATEVEVETNTIEATPTGETASTVGPPAATLTPGPTALPAPFQGESIMGIELIGPDFGSQAGLVANAGGFWVRWNAVLWSAIEPEEGNRMWGELGSFEQQILSLVSQNLVPIVIVRSTPGWAQEVPGSFCGPIRMEALDNFARFLNELVARYSAPPFNIKYWELGNEPDVDPRLVSGDQAFGCWGDEEDAFYGGAGYAEMLKAAYPAIKEADPEAQVLIGGLLLDCDPINPPETTPGSGVLKYCTPAKFLEGILSSGGGDFFDGVSFHAYDLFEPTSGYFGNPNWNSGYTLSGLNSVLVPKVRYIKSLLATYGHSDKYLINTETSLLCGRTGAEPECNTGAHTRMKTDYVVMSYTSAVAEGLAGNIWFTLDNPWRRSALMQPNGAPTSVYAAYQFVAQQLDGAVFWGNVAEFEGATGYKFRRGDVEFWVIWSQDAASHLIELAEMPAALYDSVGNPLQPAQTLEISASPIYVNFGP